VIVTQIGCMGTILAAKYVFIPMQFHSPENLKFNFVICIIGSV